MRTLLSMAVLIARAAYEPTLKPPSSHGEYHYADQPELTRCYQHTPHTAVDAPILRVVSGNTVTGKVLAELT